MASQAAISRICKGALLRGKDSLLYLVYRVLCAQEDQTHHAVRRIISQASEHALGEEKLFLKDVVRELDANHKQRTCMSVLLSMK